MSLRISPPWGPKNEQFQHDHQASLSHMCCLWFFLTGIITRGMNDRRILSGCVRFMLPEVARRSCGDSCVHVGLGQFSAHGTTGYGLPLRNNHLILNSVGIPCDTSCLHIWDTQCLIRTTLGSLGCSLKWPQLSACGLKTIGRGSSLDEVMPPGWCWICWKAHLVVRTHYRWKMSPCPSHWDNDPPLSSMSYICTYPCFSVAHQQPEAAEGFSPLASWICTPVWCGAKTMRKSINMPTWMISRSVAEGTLAHLS